MRMDGSEYPEKQPEDQEESSAEEQEEPSPDDFPEEVIEDFDAKPDRIKVESMTSIVARLSDGDKIKLALIGNKEARGMLIKERNKVVVKNVLENPRVTDDEVISYAGNKNLSGEVARIVASKKKFLRVFKVKCALVENPKTPVPAVMKIMPGLPERVLRELARSRSVTGVVKITARRILTQRGKL
jgi:hypothetical protein